MSVNHKPAAAWSRDSLAAWQHVAERTAPTKGWATDVNHSHIEFLRRWAAKIVVLVNDEMGFCDWYWFLCNHFDKELKRLDPYSKPLRDLEFTRGDFETDPRISETTPASAAPGSRG